MTTTPNQIVADLRDKICKSLTDFDRERLAAMKEDLINENTQFSRVSYGFLFGGTFFHHLTKDQLKNPGVQKPPLDPSLHEKGHLLVDQITALEKNTKHLHQGLSVLLRDCENEQDVRDAVPESVLAFVPELKPWPRTRPPAWTLQDKPLQLDQYQHTKATIAAFIASRILN